MWWLFEKALETDQYIDYFYSTGSDTLDGKVRFDKVSKETMCITPCSADADSKLAQQYAAEKLYTLSKKGFPQRYQVACG